ncbi:9694_t:CDS:2, partial [Racocetra fulgida]
HLTQCSYERKKLYYHPPFTEWPKNLKEAVNLFETPEDEHFDANDSVQETVVIIQNNGDEPIYISNDKRELLSLDTTSKQRITLFRVYSRKVDTAITYSPETEESEHFETPLEYLRKVISETPSTSHK